MTEKKRPLLTKPAGVFVQLLSIPFIFSGLYNVLFNKNESIISSGIILIIGLGLLALGRRTV